MSALLFLFSACFLGQGELDALRWDEDAQCWERATAIVDNWYWWEYTDRVGTCADHPITWSNAEGTCWMYDVTCGDLFADDPTIGAGCWDEIPGDDCATGPTDTGP